MNHYEAIPLDDSFSIEVLPDKISAFQLNGSQKKRVDEIWTQSYEMSEGKLFNGNIFILKTVDSMRLCGYFIDYKHYLAQMLDPALRQAIPIEAVTVNGITYAGEKMLIGQRSSLVSTCQRLWELAPSGGIDSSAIIGGKIDYISAVLKELEEETTLADRDILSATPLALVREADRSLAELCVKIHVNESVIKSFSPPKTEYTEFLWLTKEELGKMIGDYPESFVPLSIFLFNKFIS